jgi:hypothetical protein
MPVSLYEVHKANYLSVSGALTQIERAVNDALRRGDSPAATSFTLTQMLLVAVKAEARLRFELRFDEHYRKIKSSHENLKNIDFSTHAAHLKASKENIKIIKTS